MAINLQAVLRLDGNQFTNQMRQVQRQVQHANRVMQSAGTINTQLGRSMRTTSASTRTLTASQTQLRNAVQRSQSATTQLSSSQSQLQRQTQATSNATQHLNRSVSRTTSSFGSIGRSAGSAIRSIGDMTTAVLGLAGAYAGVQGAKKIFESTIGEAAKYEQSTIIISAMLDSKKLGKEYVDMVDRFAIDSPIMDSQTMLGNSKSFITASKDMKQLEKMWSLAERMAAIDPMQGVEGAVFALREMFSGDAISMVRRFEMPKKVMNEIKKMDLPDQLDALDKYFSSIGMTQKLIDEMGGTTLGVWAQVKEATNVIMRDMGAPALAKVKDFVNKIRSNMATVQEVVSARNLFSPEEYSERLNRAIRFEKFKETGAKIIESIATGFINGAVGIGRWIESIQQNEEFQKQTTLFGKVKWVIGDVYQNFTEWLDGGGRDKIAKTASDLIQILTASIEASIEHVLPIAIKVGSAIASGIMEGFSQILSESWVARLLQGDPIGFAVNEGLNAITGREKKWDVFGYQTRIDDKKKKREAKSLPKKNGGLNRVPYDGAVYSLHKGEKILPRGEADSYRNGGRNSGVTITGNTFNVRQESDIKAVAYELARLIETEGAQMA